MEEEEGCMWLLIIDLDTQAYTRLYLDERQQVAVFPLPQ